MVSRAILSHLNIFFQDPKGSRHAGDLGNVHAEGGVAKVNYTGQCYLLVFVFVLYFFRIVDIDHKPVLRDRIA
jgi:hypothetical protein